MLRHRFFILLLLFLLLPPFVLCLNQEGVYLQRAKLGFDDLDGVLSNWDPRKESPCDWNGVVCDSDTGSVTSLDLASSNISGPFPSIVYHLKNLNSISFYDNFINSTLPEDDLAECQSLKHLDLAQNYLTGELPGKLADLPMLKYLDLTGNNFSGNIPESFGRFQKLEVLSCSRWLRICWKGSFLHFWECFDSEAVKSIKNSPLRWIDVSTNEFSGQIPENLCINGVLEEVLMIENSFPGEIPATLAECRSLLRVGLGHNNFSGEVPERFWGLPYVSLFELIGNSFSGGIAKTIAGASNLSQLLLSGNKFSGNISEEIGFLGNLLEFSGNDNKNLGNLLEFSGNDNQFLGKC